MSDADLRAAIREAQAEPCAQAGARLVDVRARYEGLDPIEQLTKLMTPISREVGKVRRANGFKRRSLVKIATQNLIPSAVDGTKKASQVYWWNFARSGYAKFSLSGIAVAWADSALRIVCVGARVVLTTHPSPGLTWEEFEEPKIAPKLNPGGFVFFGEERLALEARVPLFTARDSWVRIRSWALAPEKDRVWLTFEQAAALK